jgi:hypothetical protein
MPLAVTTRPVPTALLSLCLVAAAACSKGGRASGGPAADDVAAAPSSTQANCGHAACGSNFFLDVVPGPDCIAGATCTVGFALVATGQYHINDEYPYKLKADDAPGVEFLGADATGKNVFSKAASDWRKRDEKSGVMTLAYRAADKGSKTVGGTFKLSVCSAENCQLEQERVKATVAVK